MSTQPPTEEFGAESKGRSPWLIIGGIVGVLIVLAIAWAVLGGGQAEPTPEPPVLPTVVAVESDAVCERVDASGTIVVGTAGDYPPFEFYNDQFQLDGFDVALMRAVGQTLGVTVDFRDYAFDGLNGALTLGEIDAAIAAITVTGERDALVDFSDGYYYGVGAALARAGSEPSSITAPGDFAGWRVGVERGSVYQAWAQTNLVATGIVPEQDLFAYERAQDAVRDLLQERLDIVLLDDAAALSAAADGTLAVVGEGAVAQVYAIAVPQDAACIQRRLNQALADLAATGTIDDLARQYVGVLSAPIPTPTPAPATPEPTATAAPAACIDSSQYVMDLTYDDEGGTNPPSVQPSENFTKGWRIRNSGTCPWNPDYRLTYVGGNNDAAQMDGEPVEVVGEVAPGQTYDFYVDLNAPSGVYGTLQGRWQMQNPAQVLFGETVFVMVEVVAPTPSPTAPAQATATAAPPATGTSVPAATATPAPQPTETPTAAPNPLEGLTFGFYAINGLPTIPGTTPLLSFGSDGALDGSDGCNTFVGTYAAQPSGTSQGGLTIAVGPGTTLACPEDVMAQAQSFRTALGLVSAYYLPPKGVTISLLDQTGAAVMDGQLQ
jgi:polar amino acid transport system substrate-binding protein